MIHIPRTNRPPFLRRSKAKKAYQDRRVVSELWKMQRHKCCYCESVIPELGHAKAIEHFRPQALFPSKRNEWKNLLLACAQCNGLKSDEFPVVVLGCDEPAIQVDGKQPGTGVPGTGGSASSHWPVSASYSSCRARGLGTSAASTT
ncbi:MAG: HNH endonuclease, partial [Planctomycetes bacterium]|nr:HNH endonuclease [Planctomycetota bacterium]